MNYNNLIGTLPNLKSPDLLYLDVAGNTLVGSIPSELFLLPSLSYMYLSNNTMSGSIPSSFGDSTSLIAVWLDGNKFNGTVPEVPSPNGWPLISE
jgi:Leucine-rich repeat (LRR) protein